MIETIRSGEASPYIIKKINLVIAALNAVPETRNASGYVHLPIVSHADHLPGAPIGSMTYCPDSGGGDATVRGMTSIGWLDATLTSWE